MVIRPKTAVLSVDDGIEILEILRLASQGRTPLLAIFPNLNDAERAAALLPAMSSFLGLRVDCVVVPETVSGEKFIPGNEAERVKAMHLARAGSRVVFLASVGGVFSHCPSPESFDSRSLMLFQGMKIPFHSLVASLLQCDYDDECEVSSPREFARKGGILDVFSPAAAYPARIEFFGETIDSIKLFNPDSQRSFQNTDEYIVVPGLNSMEAEQKTFLDLFSSPPPAAVVSPDKCRSHLDLFGQGWETDAFDSLIASEQEGIFIFLDPAAPPPKAGWTIQECDIRSVSDLFRPEDGKSKDTRGNFYAILHSQLAADTIRQWLDSDYKLFVTGVLDNSHDHMLTWCSEKRVDFSKIQFLTEGPPFGFVSPSAKFAFVPEKEIFSSIPNHIPALSTHNSKQSSPSMENPPSLQHELEVFSLDHGDYAVHLNHGICIYKGITTLPETSGTQEMFELEFAENLKLYVPVRQANLLSRYLGSKKDIPELSKVGGKSWGNARLAAAKDIRDMAVELLGVQAARIKTKGFPFPKDDSMQHLFERSFPFAETPDQIRSAADIKKDMASSRPMDRLLCGDVGFGKTEVAMRAAFKAVAGGKQVAILVPTTILAQQHFYNFSERFAQYPVLVETLSRFRTPHEQKNVLKMLWEGKVDIIIGTHRLIQADVKFHDLGLLVIDEEQRFGVSHKERLKRLRANVDVLTMTATPIPRTLYMSMTGLRDMSTIMTPPGKRLPVRTFVARQDDDIAAEAIRQEVGRGGQVYYLHNRIESITKRCARLTALVPDAKFAVAHGKMHEKDLESVMGTFLGGEIDVLVCTTIIESGLDIPNANTIVIDRADRFGLSDLYQLRGRVGRWHRQAYAYLFLPPESMLTGSARKRIAAIKRYTELGSGLRLALRDLEIRGSGNILGIRQSGHINAIGFDLYCRLLKDAVASTRKGSDIFVPQVDIDIDFIVYSHEHSPGCLCACIPESFIESEKIRVKYYKIIAAATSDEELEAVRNELADIFGNLPAEVSNFLTLSSLRILLAISGICSRMTVKKGKVLAQHGSSIIKVKGNIPQLSEHNPEAQLSELRSIIQNMQNEKNIVVGLG